MKLKLSNLLAIIAVIFFLYYYFIQLPLEQAKQIQEQVKSQIQEKPIALDTGVTQLLPLRSQGIENFNVTPITSIINLEENDDMPSRSNVYDYTDMYDLAGNVRPDNVMFAGNEPATDF